MKTRPPGRPPLDDEDPSVHVGVTLPSKQYDQLAKRALLDRISVPSVIRQDLKTILDRKKSKK